MKQLLCFLCVVALKAQSISITTPAANDAVSGFSGYYFQSSLNAARSVVKVCYVVDSYPAYNPGIDGPTTLGCSVAPPFAISYNTFWNGNGSHQLVAQAYNALGALVTTSAAVPFTTSNTWPLSYVSGMTTSYGTALSSPWSGIVNVTPTFSGTGSGNSKTFYLYLDGVQQLSNTTPGTTPSFQFNINTVQVQNGNHIVCVVAIDNTAGTTYTGPGGGYNGSAGETCGTANFQNSATPSQVVTNASEIYVAPAATFTWTAKTLKTDGTTASNTTLFTCDNTAIATVGQSSGAVTGVANGTTILNAMTETISASDLVISSFFANQVTSASHPFTVDMAGRLVQITGGTGFTPGIYKILSVGATNHSAQFTVASAGTVGSTGGSFNTGPTRNARVYVWPTNTLPHFSGTGTTLTAYDPAHSFIPHSMFQSAPILTLEQPYQPGFLADISNSGLNTFEDGNLASIPANASTLAAFQSAQNAAVATEEAKLSGCSKCKFALIGDSLFGGAGNADFYDMTSGRSSTWTPTTGWEYIVQSLTAQGNIIGATMIDEGAYDFIWYPLMGPLSYSNSYGQSWLQQIVASSGTCTATTTGSWSIELGTGGFIIHGSAIANMNSVAPAVYTASVPNSTTSGTFNFTCTGVPNGTYNSSNDPGLVLEPIGNYWQNSNTDYIHYNAFASIIAQAHAVTGAFALSYPIIGTFSSRPAVMAAWNGNSVQSLPNPIGTGTITQATDAANIYWAHGVLENYLVSRLSANSIDQPGDIGYQLRAQYGTYNPSIPLISLTQSTVNFYGMFNNQTVAVTSCVGSTITFSAPHGITNIIPGMTRLYITGAADSGSPANSCNNNFYIYSAPTSTTLTVALAATDFTSTGNTTNGGTITYADGTTLSLSQINATGTVNNCTTALFGTSGNICGDIMLATTASQNNYRKRGQTFTCSGCGGTGASAWNSRTFLLVPENLNLPAGGNNHNFLQYREIPSLNATGGTAVIIPDNNYVKGRSASISFNNNDNDTNAGWTFGTGMACMLARCVEDRWYQIKSYWSGYSDQWGFTGQFAGSDIPVFAPGATSMSAGQMSMHPHFENASSVPLFKAASNVDTIWTRYQKYILQPTLNSPDTGQPWIDCSARAGTYGDIAFCFNASDGPQTVTINLSPYLQSGQQIIQQVANDRSIGAAVALSAGTTSVTITLQAEDAVFFVFPVSFASELQQPTIAAQLADVTNAVKIVVRYSYDLYYLDVAGNVFDCGTGTCTPQWDRNIGTMYYRLIYLGPNSEVLATSDVQTL